MSLFKKSPPDLGKIKPQPYESFEEAEQKREQDAVAVNPRRSPSSSKPWCASRPASTR